MTACTIREKTSLLLPIFAALLLMHTSGANAQPQSTDTEVVVPTEPIELFNGKDLSNFDTWLDEHGLNTDPNNVYSVVDRVDGAPAIRISGEDWGGLVTKKAYADYHLIAEYRWGAVTWGDRKHRTRDNGILLHSQGEPGNRSENFDSPWMQSIEFQIIEGGVGDIIILDGHTTEGEHRTTTLTTTVTEDRDGESVWDPQGTRETFDGGRINWFGRDADWQDVIGYRGPADVTRPVGQWNRIEAFVEGGSATYVVNGVVVNGFSDSNLESGKLLIQSEAAETFFRKIEVRPLPEEIPTR
jgi:hypothetical protein